MQRVYVERRKLVAALLDERPVCERCNFERAVDVHEKVRRSQSSQAVLDVSVMITVCRGCHEWIGAHPRQAVAEGLAMWGWQYRQGAVQ